MSILRRFRIETVETRVADAVRNVHRIRRDIRKTDFSSRVPRSTKHLFSGFYRPTEYTFLKLPIEVRVSHAARPLAEKYIDFIHKIKTLHEAQLQAYAAIDEFKQHITQSEQNVDVIQRATLKLKLLEKNISTPILLRLAEIDANLLSLRRSDLKNPLSRKLDRLGDYAPNDFLINGSLYAVSDAKQAAEMLIQGIFDPNHSLKWDQHTKVLIRTRVPFTHKYNGGQRDDFFDIEADEIPEIILNKISNLPTDKPLAQIQEFGIGALVNNARQSFKEGDLQLDIPNPAQLSYRELRRNRFLSGLRDDAAKATKIELANKQKQEAEIFEQVLDLARDEVETFDDSTKSALERDKALTHAQNTNEVHRLLGTR